MAASETQMLRMELERRVAELEELRLRERTMAEELDWRRQEEKVGEGRPKAR